MTSYGTQSHYSDQRFAAADGNVGDFPPLYSDLPFSRRRKYGQSRDKDAIKWAMRCVLASPVIVLCLWTVGAFVFANKHVGSNTSTQLKQRQAQMAPQSPQLLMMPQQQLQAQPLMLTQQGGQPLQLQQEQPQMQQPVMMMSQQQPLMQQTMQEQPAMQQAMQGQPVMQQAVEEQPMMQQTMQEQPIMQRAKKSKNKKSHFRNPQQPQQPGAINLVPRDQPMAIQQQPPQQPRQQILYYEPSHAMANGKLEAPMVVYDLNGNPIPLQSLKGAQIYMEPPLLKQQVQAPLKGISTSDIKDWGQSPAQDQSIIVATVAVMALLVGAISARRMRSRNILSSCIENEALEDDVAYDTAYTTTQKDNSYYNTFASGGWKGDLEKFDV